VREQPFRRSAPDWMQDFEVAATTPTAPVTKSKPASQPPAPSRKTSVSTKSKPDWMKDFE